MLYGHRTYEQGAGTLRAIPIIKESSKAQSMTAGQRSGLFAFLACVRVLVALLPVRLGTGFAVQGFTLPVYWAKTQCRRDKRIPEAVYHFSVLYCGLL